MKKSLIFLSLLLILLFSCGKNEVEVNNIELEAEKSRIEYEANVKAEEEKNRIEYEANVKAEEAKSRAEFEANYKELLEQN